jgi:toluene monooxygenase system ferredoxin subunit
MAFKRVADLDQIWEGETLAVQADGQNILIILTGGEVFAYENRCPHLGVPLSEGQMHEGAITCSAHGWSFDARTGLGLNPCGVKLRRYPVRIEGSAILVGIEPTTKQVSHADF